MSSFLLSTCGSSEALPSDSAGSFLFVSGKMPKSCCAVGCTNRALPDSAGRVKFYKFPSAQKAPERRRRWIGAVRRQNWEPNDSSRICSAHFVGGEKSDEELSPAYVPQLFSFVSSPVKRKAEVDLEAYQRRSKRCRQLSASATELVDDELNDDLSDLPAFYEAEMNASVGPCLKSSVDTSTQTDVTAESLADLESEYERIIVQNKKDCAPHLESLSQESFSHDNAKVRFYTGLPSYGVMMAVFEHVKLRMASHQRHSLPLFYQFLLVLMKLRLNSPDFDLAYRFGVSQSTVSRIFERWIQVMFVMLKPLVKWPEREELRKTMPLEFRQSFSRCVVIIDCIEVFCERPSDLMARAQTYSHYKSHNTIKFLIGIAPQGVITFISHAWGGRASDKYITEHCGLLNRLLPGDQVLADRGFTVGDSVGMFCAELVMPPFTKGKKQLERVDIDNARQMSRVRIHVERVIGMLRQKYTILSSTLPIAFLMHNDQDKSYAFIDMVVTVCCALCNCCESVIQFQ